MPMVRARMAVWLLVEPPRVTNPRSFRLSSCTVSLGDRSSAIRMKGSSQSGFSSAPARTAWSRWATSRTSAARACM